MLVAGAKRPLSLDELREAVALDLNDTRWDQVTKRLHTDKSKMIQNCGNLVTTNTSLYGIQVAQFTHHTVLEYLLLPQSEQFETRISFQMSIPEVAIFLGKFCLKYIGLMDSERARQISIRTASTKAFISTSAYTGGRFGAFSHARRILFGSKIPPPPVIVDTIRSLQLDPMYLRNLLNYKPMWTRAG